MTKPPVANPRILLRLPRRRSALFGVFVLLLGLAGTALVTQFVASNIREDGDAAFALDAEDTRASVEQRLVVYEESLRGLYALFAASKVVSRDEFKTYVEAGNTSDRSPGLQALSFNRYLTAEIVKTFEESVRTDRSVTADGYPDFAVFPMTGAAELSVVDYLEPMEGNDAAFGFDLRSNPARLRTIEIARDSGEAIATEPIRLVQETGEQAGFILMLSVYDNDMPQSTVAERRQAFRGSVNAVFRADDMFRGVLNADREIQIEVYDVGSASDSLSSPRSAEGLLFESDPGSSETRDGYPDRYKTQPLEIGGRRWDLVVTQTSVDERGALAAWLVALLGLVLTIGATRSTVRLAHDRDKALWDAGHHAYRASHDSLTGLPNRALFTDRVDHALALYARGKGLISVMFVDLDHFKQVNDTHGHAAGDLLLKEVANFIQAELRDNDTVARFAGDEFIVLAEDLETTDDGMALALRVCAAIQKVKIAGDPSHLCSASIGVSFSVDGDSDTASLVRRADQAMYRAKQAGGNQVWADTEHAVSQV